MIIAALMDILAPEGSFKKYCRLASGFAVIAVILSPLTGSFWALDFDGGRLDTQAAEADARARILTAHKQNLEAAVEAQFPHSRAYVEVDNDGNVVSLTVDSSADPDEIRAFARDQLGLTDEDVTIRSEGTADNIGGG